MITSARRGPICFISQSLQTSFRSDLRKFYDFQNIPQVKFEIELSEISIQKIHNWFSFHFSFLCSQIPKKRRISSLIKTINSSMSLSLKRHFLLFYFSIITDPSNSLQSKYKETCPCLDLMLPLANVSMPSMSVFLSHTTSVPE